MIEVSLFKTKNQSQLKERIEAIKALCKTWTDTRGPTEHETAIEDFREIWTMCRNIELSDLPLIYDPASQDWEHIDTMEREAAPNVGDTIVIECGDTVEVIHVSHQWDNPELVQVMTRESPQ